MHYFLMCYVGEYGPSTHTTTNNGSPWPRIKKLSFEAENQRKIGDKIAEALTSNRPIDLLIENFNPSLIPIELDPYFYLERAIKLGNPEHVKKLFRCYKEKRKEYKEEMRDSIYMETPYRPIFWLAAVCDSKKVPFGTPPPEEYIDIIEFLEQELDIEREHRHPVPGGSFSKKEYIERFCRDISKRTAILAHFFPDL